MTDVKVDILMPTYKPRAEHLRAALESACAQTETRWQLHIFDEPTGVDTHSIVEPFLGDNRITFVRNEKRLGIGGNWNRCVERTHAPYVQFLFQDDLWNAEYLRHAMRVLEEHPSVGMVSMEHAYSFEDGAAAQDTFRKVEETRRSVSPGMQNGLQFLRTWIERGLHPNIIGEPSFVMLRRSTMEQAGTFREDMQQTIDAEYWAHMLAKGDWYVLRGTFGIFRVHGDAASVRNFGSGTGIFERLAALKSAIKLLPQEWQSHAKKVLQDERKRMAEKFISRYGEKQVHIPQNVPLPNFLFRHPLLLLRSAWNFYSTRRKARK
ncbi:MAG: glycosyltransferase [Candidatus Peribacteraceae bacterium]|nr:glycosyltransferase [Candidatus Peribacteraceae bacterium]